MGGILFNDFFVHYQSMHAPLHHEPSIQQKLSVAGIQYDTTFSVQPRQDMHVYSQPEPE